MATGLLAGQRIGLDGGNSIAWVVAYLAALRAGLVVVPTDPGESTDERDSLLAVCGARAVLTTRGGAADERIPSLELSEEGLAALASTATEVATPPDVESLAVIATTLGTSADPKTVMLSHRALLAHLEQVSGYGIVDSDSVVLGVLPFFHAYGLNAVLGSCLAAGARLVLPDPATWDLLTVIEAEQVDNLPITPGLLYRLVHEDDAADRLRGVRTVMVGGAPLPWRLGRRFTELTGLRVERGYGLTEASPGVTTTVGGEILGPFHVGRPLPGVEVRVGDGLDPSEPGEIAVRGANLFSGYWPDGTGGPDDGRVVRDRRHRLPDRRRAVPRRPDPGGRLRQRVHRLPERDRAVHPSARGGRGGGRGRTRPASAGAAPGARGPGAGWWRSWPVRTSPRIWSATSAGPGCRRSSDPPRCASSTIFPAG